MPLKLGFVLPLAFFLLDGNCLSNETASGNEQLEFETQYADQKASPPCFLTGIPEDTSASNRYRIDPVPDTLQNGETAWMNPLGGNGVDRTTVTPDSAGHYNYMSATWSGGNYYMVANDVTSQFVRTFKTRVMLRNINVYCADQTRQRYYFEIPIQDVTPPEFLQREYTFKISADWDRRKPISDGNFVIVGDDAFENQEKTDFLTFQASLENYLEVRAVRLWVQEYPETFYYRVDIYLHESVTLEPGQRIQVGLSARDEFNTGHTILNIHVDP